MRSLAFSHADAHLHLVEDTELNVALFKKNGGGGEGGRTREGGKEAGEGREGGCGCMAS